MFCRLRSAKPTEAGASVFVLTALPLLQSSAPLPLLESAVLVVEPDVACRKPPLDGTTRSGALTPAIGVTPALAAAGIVDPLEEPPLDITSVALHIAC